MELKVAKMIAELGAQDVKSLGVPEPGAGEADDEPRGEWEPAVARLWEELFNLARVGRRDNFFRLGGDSRLALKMTVRLSAQCAVSMHVTTIFQYPTVMELARLIAQERSQFAQIGTL